MNMGLENVGDRDARFTRHLDVDVAIRARIENGRDAFVVIANNVGKLRNAFGLDGFEDKRHLRHLTRSRKELQQDRQLPDFDLNRQQMIDHVGATVGIAFDRLRPAI